MEQDLGIAAITNVPSENIVGDGTVIYAEIEYRDMTTYA